MKKVYLAIGITIVLAQAGFIPPSQAGHEVTTDGKTVSVEPTPSLYGSITLGAMFSEEATGGFVDSMFRLWTPSDHTSVMFLNSRYHVEDNGQNIAATGLVFRKFIKDPDIIVGGNIYWDMLHSEHGNDFNQLGFGVELLTRWVDVRANYYIPENDRYEIARSFSRDSRTNAFGEVETNTEYFKRYEAGLEGLNAEIGFLIPGLERYMEVRAFGGYYYYENPFGVDYSGFKARLEARILKGVIADVEYWDDAALMGGHWTAGVRVSTPFSLYNLFTGRNPFEGISESFKPGPRDFSDRMNEMAMRSHRIQTTSSGKIRVDESRSVRAAAPNIVDSVPTSSPSTDGSGFPIE